MKCSFQRLEPCRDSAATDAPAASALPAGAPAQINLVHTFHIFTFYKMWFVMNLSLIN